MGEVLGVVRVAREPVRQSVDPGRVLTHDGLPGRRRPGRRGGLRRGRGGHELPSHQDIESDEHVRSIVPVSPGQTL